MQFIVNRDKFCFNLSLKFKAVKSYTKEKNKKQLLKFSELCRFYQKNNFSISVLF